MVDDTGHIKLIDFGIARVEKKKNQDTEHMGSMVTASPEHYAGLTDARSDIYTIGATLHYILTNGQTLECNAFDIPSVKNYNPNVTDQFSKVIDKALMVQPKDRFQTIAEMRDALKGSNYLVSSPVTSVKIESARTPVNSELNTTVVPPTTLTDKEKESEKKRQIAREAMRGIQEMQGMIDAFPANSRTKSEKSYRSKENTQKNFSTILTIFFGIIGGMAIAG